MATQQRIRYWGVVPAAGIGSRMGARMPKQYLQLQGKTIIEHTLARLHACGLFDRLLVCVNPDDQRWAALAARLSLPLQTVAGGVERCHSVFNALQALADQAAEDDWVLVHDVARPCVRPADIAKLTQRLQAHPVGGLLGVPVADTMKRVDAAGEVAATVERQGLWHAYTPQMFRFGVLYRALAQALQNGVLVTDEAAAVEQAGYRPLLVAGHRDNIKITHPDDLRLAEAFLTAQAQHERSPGE